MRGNRALPRGWVRTTLGEVGEYINGRGFKKSEWSKTGRPIIRIQDLTGSNNRPNYYSGDVDDKHIVRPGDLLVSWAATLGAYIWNGPEGCLNQHIFKVRSNIDRKFHYYLIQHVLHELERKAHGSGMVHITRKKFDSTPITIPEDSSEQRRIVAKLEELLSDLDAGCWCADRARSRLDTYREAVLSSAVTGKLMNRGARINNDELDGEELVKAVLGRREKTWEKETRLARANGRSKRYKYPTPPAQLPDTINIPSGWSIASLEQITDPVRVICYGILMPKNHVEEGVPYVRVKDMRNDGIDLADIKRTSTSIAEKYKRASLIPGDLLLSIRGTYGRVAEVPKVLDGGNITQDTARIAISPLISSRYIAWYLRSPLAQRFFRRVARGVAVKGVNIGDVRACPVVVPPLADQQSIATMLDRYIGGFDRLGSDISELTIRATQFRRALLQLAFDGRLLEADDMTASQTEF